MKLYLGLDHGWSLSPQQAHRLEHVDDALEAHSLQRYAQCDEHARPTNSHAATDHNANTSTSFNNSGQI